MRWRWDTDLGCLAMANGSVTVSGIFKREGTARDGLIQVSRARHIGERTSRIWSMITRRTAGHRVEERLVEHNGEEERNGEDTENHKRTSRMGVSHNGARTDTKNTRKNEKTPRKG